MAKPKITLEALDAQNTVTEKIEEKTREIEEAPVCGRSTVNTARAANRSLRCIGGSIFEVIRL